ncbi:MAG: PAS domain-containing protein [Rubrobacter sp.]
MTGEDSRGKGSQTTAKHGLFYQALRSEMENERVNEAPGERIGLDFKRIFRLAPGGMAVFGLNGRPVVVNSALADLFGCSDPGVYARSLEDIVHPEELPESRERMTRLLAGERGTFRFQGRFLRSDGEGFFGVADLTLVRDENGEPSYFVLNLRDDTERQKAERRLRESEERFRALVDKSSEIVKLVNLDGKLRYASPAMERVLGYSSDEIVGRNIFDFLHPDDIPALREATSKALAEVELTGETVWNTAEYRMRHADGGWRNIESVGTYLLDHPAVEGVVINSRAVR